MRNQPKTSENVGTFEALRRSVSSEDQSLPTRSLSGRPQHNAVWDSRTSHILSSTAANLLFEDNRRGSNGVIPGQQISEFSFPPSIRSQLDIPSSTIPEQEKFHLNLNRNDKMRIEGTRRNRSRIYDDPALVAGYNSVPLLEFNQLPRGGVSIETKSIGRVQVCFTFFMVKIHYLSILTFS
jgi:hypothetical protein